MFKTRRYLNRIVSVTLLLLLITITGCSRRVIDEPAFVTGGIKTSASVTSSREFEAVPSSVRNARGDIKWFAALGHGNMTFASGEWDNWTSGILGRTMGFPVEISASGPIELNELDGDAWTTYSEAKDLAFFSFIGRPPESVSSSCVAVAATAPDKLPAQDWEFPASCISAARGDQCAILHIDRTNTFYSACAFATDVGNIQIQAFDDCAGAPGVANGCPRTGVVTIPRVEQLQFSIAENPCTGNLVLVYRDESDVRIRFYDENLSEIDSAVIRSGESFAGGHRNAGCTRHPIRRCGLGSNDCCNPRMEDCQSDTPGMCLRVNGRPSIDTYKKSTGGQLSCGAVIAYDSLVEGADGNFWSKSRLDIVDITSETDPVVTAQWGSTDDEHTWNQYLSYAVVSDRGPNQRRPKIAWFWLTDIRGACNVIAEGHTSTDLGASMQATGILGGPFPGVVTGNSGLGDYIRGIKGGDDDGSLLVSWGETVPSSGQECTPCQGEKWNLATRIARIRWDRERERGDREVISPGPVVVEETGVD